MPILELMLTSTALKMLAGAIALTVASTGCAPGIGTAAAASPTTAPLVRHGFLGAFFRPVGSVPFGVFSVYSKQRAPEPYPAPRPVMYGPSGYCDAIAANGVSIASGYVVDAAKLSNIVNLGVKWVRMPISSASDDQSHVFGPNHFSFGDFDAAQCAVAHAKIMPIVGLEAGTVHYNARPDVFSPKELPAYKTADDFGGWCSAVARHERAVFPAVNHYSLPGNEVNSNPEMFPGGDAQIAAYTQACYRAIKAVEPKSIIYGFELNMEKNLDPAAFVERMYALGCKPGTCYDAIALHLFMRYPVPPPSTPCYPAFGGNYGMQCIADIRKATHTKAMHVLIGETAYLVPGSVPDERTKAIATVELMKLFAADPLIDGVNYANVDECDLYPSGFFVGGCLVDSTGHILPAYTALQTLATKYY
jgi:hypothetical protein